VTAEKLGDGGRRWPAPVGAAAPVRAEALVDASGPERVRFDVFLLAGQFPGIGHAETLANALSYATAAERAGFDGVWVAEHHFLSYGVCPSALAFAGHLLGRTDRLRVGTAACVLSNRHPVALAEEAVLLDELSGGRLDLGVARGGPWVDLEVFGTGLPRYDSGFTESVDLLLAWLSGTERVGADGAHFAFRPVRVVPRPRRPVPVWVAATSAPTVELAAARGLPLLLGMHAATDEKRSLIDHYGRSRASQPHASAPHASAHLAFVADSTREAREVLCRAMPAWLATTGGYERIDGSRGPDRDPHRYLEHLMGIHPVGTPELCVERLATSITQTGVRRVLLMVEGAGDAARTLDNIARLGTEVIPHIRAGALAGNPY
jgi:alkanesulfonate monooxygenase SsuD/methylene tetrahydromethanopterin reductase-like flavin-dependent oxidoreductase (luciferase family)